METKKIFGDVLTTANILDLIETPLDWRIGQQQYEIKYHIESFGKYSIHFPVMESDPGIG